GYDGRIGIAALKERPEAVDASAESIYALGPYFATRRELVLAWLARYGGDGPFGPFDAYSEGRWLERYYAVDQGSLALGLIGRQGASLRAFLEREGLAGRFVDLYRKSLRRPARGRP
ncbi:MAG: hypothetical protein HY553_17835, partial [Elusimicrobia bacterium]|nr:hypothetical protein [Elusimicrobiota bacterium]